MRKIKVPHCGSNPRPSTLQPMHRLLPQIRIAHTSANLHSDDLIVAALDRACSLAPPIILITLSWQR